MFKFADEEALQKFMEDFRLPDGASQAWTYNKNRTPILDPFVLRTAFRRCGCCGQDNCVRQFP